MPCAYTKVRSASHMALANATNPDAKPLSRWCMYRLVDTRLGFRV